MPSTTDFSPLLTHLAIHQFSQLMLYKYAANIGTQSIAPGLCLPC
jgi:hypothetical protein